MHYRDLPGVKRAAAECNVDVAVRVDYEVATNKHLPNFALQDQGGAQARRAGPMPGPAARLSLWAGRPGNQSLESRRRTSTGWIQGDRHGQNAALS